MPNELFGLEDLGWQANTASIATNIIIEVASCLSFSINFLACWARRFSWPQIGTVLEVVVWVWWRRWDGAEYGWTWSACLSWSARCLKRCTSSEASGEGSLVLWLFFFFFGFLRSGHDKLLISPSFFGLRLQGSWWPQGSLWSWRSYGTGHVESVCQESGQEKWNPVETHKHNLLCKLTAHLALFTLQ